MIINRVITSFQEPDNMEEINFITGLSPFSTDNWVDYEMFNKYKKLKKYVEKEKIDALENNKADYIAFRIDC